jgi:nitroreductase
MDAIELLKTRSSNGKLIEPEPDADALALAFQAVTRTPDHGALRPFRIRIVRGSARERLGELMAGALQRANPSVSEGELAKAKSKALRAPMILVVGAVLKPHPKVPEIEQILAAGAAAHTLLLALQARGYGAIWRTGGPTYDAVVKQALGFAPSDALVGFIYTGTPKQPAPPLNRPQPSDFVSEWSGAD